MVFWGVTSCTDVVRNVASGTSMWKQSFTKTSHLVNAKAILGSLVPDVSNGGRFFVFYSHVKSNYFIFKKFCPTSVVYSSFSTSSFLLYPTRVYFAVSLTNLISTTVIMVVSLAFSVQFSFPYINVDKARVLEMFSAVCFVLLIV